jgi:hypothetical protein
MARDSIFYIAMPLLPLMGTRNKSALKMGSIEAEIQYWQATRAKAGSLGKIFFRGYAEPSLSFCSVLFSRPDTLKPGKARR